VVRDELQQVAAIKARCAPDRERVRRGEVGARSRWLEARQRVDDLDAALESETADLHTRVWGAWRRELSQAERAAEVVGEGAGRLGQRRRQVRDATTELTAFAQRWHPAVRELGEDPAELAGEVRWLRGRRVEDQINAYIARTVAGAHPDWIRGAERAAFTACSQAEQAGTRLDEAIDTALRPYGRTAHLRDAADRLNCVNDELSGVERDLGTATARVRALTSAPWLRRLPGGGLDGERVRWAADREARQEAAAREANERRQRELEPARRIESPPQIPSTPDHGRGIGR
jgi:exodeoxyribonuclease V alpha subunit